MAIFSLRLDGASSLSLLWRILVPNVAPAVKTMAALVFLWTWNAFLLPLVMVSNSSLYTVTVGLSTFTGAHFNNYSALAAGSCLAALPVVVEVPAPLPPAGAGLALAPKLAVTPLGATV